MNGKAIRFQLVITLKIQENTCELLIIVNDVSGLGWERYRSSFDSSGLFAIYKATKIGNS